MICLKNRTFAVSQTTRHYSCKVSIRCDLLEKSYFCSIANNIVLSKYGRAVVVICLKNRTFAVSQTTLHGRSYQGLSCDLLEKSYFCSIANNFFFLRSFCNSVVICLKNRTFAVSQTTLITSIAQTISCDLLEKSYFCSIANNRLRTHVRVPSVVICLKNRTFAVSQTTQKSVAPM